MYCMETLAIFGSLVSLLGIIGNIIAFCTLGKMGRQNASTTLLRYLAIVDSTLLVRDWIIGGVYSFTSNAVVIGILVAFFHATVHTATIWTPVLVGIHRYIVVCKPLLATSLCTVSNARKHFVVVVAISVIVNFPKYFEHSITARTLNITTVNGSLAILQRDASPWYTIGYNKVFRMGLMNYAIPVLSLLFITVSVLRTLRSSRQRRSIVTGAQVRGQAHGDRTVDVMVIVVLVVFMICHIFHPVVIHFGDSLRKMKDGRIIVSCMISALVFLPTKINSAINCLIYIAFNKTFRQTLCPCCGTVVTAPNASQRWRTTTAMTE